MKLLRPLLADDGVLSAADLADQEHGSRVRVAGVVTHRQRPHTASGMIFLNLEDETGLLNVVCRAGMWRRYRSIGRRAVALIVRGTVEKGDGVVALMLIASRSFQVFRVPAAGTGAESGPLTPCARSRRAARP